MRRKSNGNNHSIHNEISTATDHESAGDELKRREREERENKLKCTRQTQKTMQISTVSDNGGGRLKCGTAKHSGEQERKKESFISVLYLNPIMSHTVVVSSC